VLPVQCCYYALKYRDISLVWGKSYVQTIAFIQTSQFTRKEIHWAYRVSKMVLVHPYIVCSVHLTNSLIEFPCE